jgi:hypothetical protein
MKLSNQICLTDLSFCKFPKYRIYTRCFKMIVEVCRLIILISIVKRIINASSNETIIAQFHDKKGKGTP